MATPQDNYQVSPRSGFIGQVGNIGTSNQLSGGFTNSSVGGTNVNGVAPTNAATVNAFALVKNNTTGGGAANAVSASSFSPPAIQQDVAIDKRGEEPVQFTSALVSPAATSDLINFPKSNKEVVLPVANEFSKTATNVTIGGTLKPNYKGITNTKTFAEENDLTRLQVEARGEYVAANGETKGHVDGADFPLGDPTAQQRKPLEGNRSNSSMLPSDITE